MICHNWNPTVGLLDSKTLLHEKYHQKSPHFITMLQVNYPCLVSKPPFFQPSKGHLQGVPQPQVLGTYKQWLWITDWHDPPSRGPPCQSFIETTDRWGVPHLGFSCCCSGRWGLPARPNLCIRRFFLGILCRHFAGMFSWHVGNILKIVDFPRLR